MARLQWILVLTAAVLGASTVLLPSARPAAATATPRSESRSPSNPEGERSAERELVRDARRQAGDEEAQLGSIEVRITFGSESPEVGVWFDAVLEGPLGTPRERLTAVSFAADDGFVLAGLEPGRYRALATAEGWGVEAREFHLAGADLERNMEWTARRAERFSGVVVDATGSPVEGAFVHAAALGELGARRAAEPAVTGPAGRFDLSWLGVERGARRLLVRHPSAGSASLELGSKSNDGLLVVLDPGRELRGRVLDRFGAGIQNASVECVQDTRSLAAWHLTDELDRATVLSDAEGRFTFAGIWSRTVRLRAEADGFATRELDDAVPGSAPILLELAASKILEGLVQDSGGSPVSGARVELVGEDRRASASSASNTQGRFRLQGFDERAAALVASAPGYASTELAWSDADAGPATLVLQRPGRLIGTLNRFDGRTFELVLRAPAGREKRKRFAQESFVVDDLPPGRLDVAIARDGSPLRSLGTFDVPPGATVDLGMIAVSSGGRIRARVVDAATGEPVPATCFLHVVERTTPGSAAPVRARTDSAGGVVFEGLDEALFELELHPDRGGYLAAPTVAISGTLDVDLGTLEVQAAAALEVVLTGAHSERPTADLSVSCGRNLLAFGPTDDGGRAYFSGLPAGEVLLRVAADGRALERAVRLEAGATRLEEVDLATLEGRSWSARLLLGERPAAGVDVRVRALDGAWTSARSESDAEGRIQVEGVQEGPSEVLLTHPGGARTIWRSASDGRAPLPDLVRLRDATLEVRSQPGTHVRVVAGASDDELATARCDELGECSLVGLPEGSVRVVLQPPEDRGRALPALTKTLDLVEGTLQRLEVAP